MLSPANTSPDALPSDGQLAFLRRITHDDLFRSVLEADPHRALAEYGLHLDPQAIPSRVELPSKRTLCDYLEESGEDGSDFLMPWMGFIAA